MKSIKYQKKLLNSLFILFSLFILSKGDIFNNPLSISQKVNLINPIIIKAAIGVYFVFTSGEYIILDSNGEIQSRNAFATYNNPYVLIKDQSYNYYIFAQSESEMHKVTFYGTSVTYSSQAKPSITYSDSWVYLGAMSETYNSGGYFQGCLCPINANEVIIYGRKNSYYLIFSFLVKNTFYQIQLGTNSMEHKIICKIIQSGQYLCVVAHGYIIHIYLFSHLVGSYPQCEMKNTFYTTFDNLLNNHGSVELFDTNTITRKILCAKNRDTSEIECLLFQITINMQYSLTSCTQTQNIVRSNILFKLPIPSSTTLDDCIIRTFDSENLLCCGLTDLIRCARIDYSTNNIKNIFDLEFPGSNSKLTFFTDANTYANFIFLNSNSGNNNLYEYFIYVPTCKDLNYTIIVYHSINEEKGESEKDNLNDLFERKTNTKYFFEFETLPDVYGDLMINNEKIIEGNNTKFLLENGVSYIIDFISTNDKPVTNYQIPYKISIEETYSASCSINLTILSCYKSCEQCSKDASSSTSDEHNCLENKCKIGHYPSPLSLTNCFSEDEKEINWYLNYSISRFALCNDKCNSCYGPDENNCLTCFSPEKKAELNYLLNNKCLNECPEGTYAEEQTEGYYKCKSCYINCKTCNEKGNNNNMKCESCNETDIIYAKNCYKVYNNEEKTFYKAGSNTEITSCFELLSYYIKENTYECISTMPSTGYFLVNSNTGLFAKCHSDCNTCSQNYTEISSNCDTCTNSELYLLDGNCISSCPEGYYSKIDNGINICKKCFKNCLTCTQGEIYSGTVLTNMNCLKCKKGVDPNDSNNLIEDKIKLEQNCFEIITYTEEKIIFDVSELNNGETEKSCFDYGKVIIYEEYQCIEKPINSYYVLNGDENYGVIKLCDEACVTCDSGKNILTGDTNCKNCTEGYFKTQDSNTNCILESLIPENYFKNNSDNIFYKCYSRCKKCDEYYDIERNDMHCTECITDFYFVYETNNCYEMSFVDENDYFFSERDNKFHKCYFSCLKCSQLELDEYNHNCDECITGFYFEYNTQNCYNDSVLIRGYYLDDFNINVGEDPVYKKCYENCKTCNDTIINNNMNCILCKDNLYKINGTNNCYDESLKNEGYYLKNDLFYPCEENCKTCSDSKTIINNITSNNCLSCDYLTKGFYLVSDLKNCEPESFKENGYYLQEDPDNSDIKIFYKCYFSCALCDLGKESSNHNCLKCEENFYPMKEDINPKNCYNETEMIPQGFYLVRNYWTICHENCEECNGIKPEYDSNNKLISQNCFSCYDDLHFIYNTLNCVNDSILSKGYYFSDIDEMYHQCDIQCKTCDKYSTSEDPKCTSCNNDLGYYLAYDKPSSKCYNKSTIDSQYILSTIINQTTGEIIKKWMICYKTCKTCSNLGNDENNNCVTCISKFYLIYGTSNCIKSDYARENGYYFNTTYGQFVKCDKACLTCTDGLKGKNTNCIKCNTELGYFPIKGKGNSMCYNAETIGEGYFFNSFSESYFWEECYQYCASCEYKGNAKKMACLSCKTDLINEEYNKTLYFKFSNGNCNIGCPNNLFLTKQYDCLPSCLNGTYEFIPNVTCVDTCPENYVVNQERTRCVFSGISNSTSSSEFKDIIFQNISAYVDKNTVINGTNFKAQIIAASDIDPVEQIKNGISGLDFGDCIETLKAKYNIPADEDLIVIEIESKEDKEKNKNYDRTTDSIDLGKDVKVSICDKNGNILDLSFCANDITVMKYVGDVEDIDINTAMDYAEQGIDVFNTQDAFFNDRCAKVDTDQDIILGDRRTDIFQNVSFCGDYCTYNGMDYTLMIAKCSCNPGNIQDTDINIETEEEAKKGITLNDLANSFTSEIFSFNFDVIKCYNLVFDLSILKKNKGFFTFIIMIILQIFFFIYFMAKRFKPIKNYMLVFEPFDPRIDPPNPPKKKYELKKEFNSSNKKKDILGLFDNKIYDNKNKNKSNKEFEIKKSYYINELLNRNKNKSKEKNNKDNIDYDNALVVYYENSDEDSEDDDSYYSDEKEQEKEKGSEINSSSNSNSEDSKEYKTKIKLGKKYSNPKVYNRNKNQGIKAFHKFSKETIIPEINNNKNNNNKNTKKEKDIYNMNTLESNDISPRNIHFKELNSFKFSTKQKRKEIIDESDERKEDQQKSSIKYTNQKTLKNALKKRNNRKIINVLSSKDDLFSDNKIKSKTIKSLENISVKYFHKNKITNKEDSKKTETESELNKKKQEKNELGNMKLKFKKVNYSLTFEEINDLDFEQALAEDNRSFFRIFLSYILSEHIIMNTFCTDAYLELRAIKLSFLVFGYEISFFLNALFYTDEYISDTYHNDGVLDFFSSLPKSIYSFIVTLVISNLLKILSSSKRQLNKIIAERKDKKEYLEAVEKELKKFKKKIIWYFIIVFILTIFFSYYVAAFCAVYQNSQNFWLIGCLESSVLDFLTPFVICLILSSLRYIGLKKKSKCAYDSAKYLGILM